MAAVGWRLPVTTSVLSCSTHPITGDFMSSSHVHVPEEQARLNALHVHMQLIAAGSGLVAMVTDTVSVEAVWPLTWFEEFARGVRGCALFRVALTQVGRSVAERHHRKPKRSLKLTVRSRTRSGAACRRQQPTSQESELTASIRDTTGQVPRNPHLLWGGG